MKLRIVMLLAAVIMLGASASQAAIIASGENTIGVTGSGAVLASHFTGQISSSDLIQNGSPTLAGWSRSVTPYFESVTLNDGQGHTSTQTQGTFLPATLGGGRLPATYTYNFAPTVGSLGYQLDSITSFAGWNANGATLGNQKYELLVSYVGSPGFTSLGTFEYSPFNNSSSQTAGSTKFTLSSNNSGGIATGVSALQFVFQDHGFFKTSVDGTVYYEVDVKGAALLAPRVPVVSYNYVGTATGAMPDRWADTGGIELTNGVIPGVDFQDGDWVGSEDSSLSGTSSHPQVTFTLDGLFDLEQAAITYLHSTSQAGGSITAPESVLVSTSLDGTNFSTPVSLTGFDSLAGDEVRTAWLDLSALDEARFVRFDFRNTSNWTFLGEVQFEGLQVVPEPSTYALAGLALLGLGLAVLRKRRMQ